MKKNEENTKRTKKTTGKSPSVSKKSVKTADTAKQSNKPAANKPATVKTTAKLAAKRCTTKPASKTTTKTAAKLREIKVGDKIVGQVNGAIGIVKAIKTDAYLAPKPRPYAVIDWQNATKKQDKQTVADIKYLQEIEKRGGIKITTPRKVNKPVTTANKPRQSNTPPKKSATGKRDGDKPSHPQGEAKKSSVGEIHRGNTKYIDTEPKQQRNYAVVKDKDGKVTVAKVKTIKKFDENGKNADPALVEINHERYGLPERSGVDFETFDKNRMTNKPLKLSDKDVFPEQQPRGKLNSKDKHRVLIHTGQIIDPKKKKGGNSK